ncbi:hypothetical protein [uncultured Methylobacterium sp.]|mgnify:CR=1 FL=1|jgi:hypothetical protein|uniref:hypothetical protein n=1 Tax=uncultured Methylobacterium sp. TaxID=157278 RepID=UPI002606BC93|nr:hypothetical protein [uncultured Methylobacterium sp.]
MDRPIIFSPSMVRALLGGRKRQTRRIIAGEVPEPPAMDSIHPKNTARHPAPYLDSYCGGKRTAANPRGMSDRWCWWTRDDRQKLPTFKVPFVPGDRLWVREAHMFIGGGDPGILLYRADCREGARRQGLDNIPADEPKGWRSPIFMPRALSRLTLIVTEVRVERLQDISEEDAIAEGATMRPACHGFRQQCGGWSMDWSQVGQPSKFALTGFLSEAEISLGGAREAFGAFINELHDQRWNLKGDGIWGENPWVVAITFQTIRKNIDSLDRPVSQSSGGEA